MEYLDIPISQIETSSNFQFIPNFLHHEQSRISRLPDTSDILGQIIVKKDMSSDKYFLIIGHEIYDRYYKTPPENKSITCKLIPEAFTNQQLFELIYINNKEAIENEVLTRSYFIQKCLELFSAKDTISLFSQFGTILTNKDLQNANLILNFNKSIQLHIFHNHLSVNILHILKKLSDTDANLLIKTITFYELGKNKQKRLLDLCIQLTIKDDISISELFQNSKIKAIIETENPNKPQAISHLMEQLQVMCYPKSSQAYKEFTSRRAALGLLKNCTIEPTKAFEKDDVLFTVKFSSMEEFETRWPDLKRICK